MHQTGTISSGYEVRSQYVIGLSARGLALAQLVFVVVKNGLIGASYQLGTWVFGNDARIFAQLFSVSRQKITRDNNFLPGYRRI